MLVTPRLHTLPLRHLRRVGGMPPGYMGLVAAACVPVGARVPVVPPNDGSNPSQSRQRVLKVCKRAIRGARDGGPNGVQDSMALGIGGARETRKRICTLPGTPPLEHTAGAFQRRQAHLQPSSRLKKQRAVARLPIWSWRRGQGVRPNWEVGLDGKRNRQTVLHKCKPEVPHSTVRHKCIFVLYAKPG